MRCVLAILAILAAVPAAAREQFPGQYAQHDPWWNQQLSPKTGGNCCSAADGVYAEEDIRGGHYWTRFTARWTVDNQTVEQTVEWTQVPDDVILNSSNKNGQPVVWYYFDEGRWHVRCYAPGSKS